MTLDEMLVLAKAGFTAEQIMTIGNATPASQQAQAPAPSAPVSTPPVMTESTPLSEPVQPPLNQAYGMAAPMQPQYGMGQTMNNDPVIQRLDQLTRAVQANGIMNSQMPYSEPEKAEDILAKIINPPSIVKGDK